ncbi:MAG: hypothetical protein ACI9E5_000959, partial [Candidatus Omnitrophota bacterium]
MNITKRHWFILIVLSILSIAVWFKCTFVQLSFLDLSVNRSQALTVAQDLLKQSNIDYTQYKTATAFSFDQKANQFLQKNVGISGLRSFIDTYNFDMFYWIVRFYKEQEKEEHQVVISSKSAQVISYFIKLDENEARPTNTKAKAKEQALEFLRTTYDFDESQYKQTRDLKTSLDNRDDFSFAWQHKDVNIPWSDTDDSKSKLITKITLAGNTIVAYSKSVFYTPDSFRRFISLQRNTGNNFSSIVRIFDTILLAAAVFFVVIRRNHLVMHTAKRFYIGTMAFILGLMIISYINQYELVLHNYDTSVPFSSYLMRSCINYLLAAIVFAVYIIMPSLSGESICHENNKTRTSDGLLHNLRSTFLSRNVSQRILVGYFAFFIMLGLQALITAIGQKYWNVWVEHSWMEDSSTAYLPFIAAFIVGFKASVSEELLYRL